MSILTEVKTGTRDGDAQDAAECLKVLVVHRYYVPDTASCGAILQRIVRRWVQDGHKVDVLTGQPSYKASLSNEKSPKYEVADGARVRRLSLPSEAGRSFVRVVNAVRLVSVVLWKALTARYDVIMVSTIPPVVSATASAIAARLTGARLIYHCQDIHPEVGRLSGEFANPLVFRVLQGMDSYSCRRANPVVVLSSDMADTIRARPKAGNTRVEVLNNFSVASEEPTPDTLPFMVDPAKLSILFAGNIGRFQGLDIVIDAMARLKGRDDIEFILMGEGVARETLQRQARQANANVRFVGHQPVAVAKACMRQVDAGFVSLVPGLYRYVYPSKTMAYLEQGCPLIVAAEQESELVKSVEADGVGYSVPSGDGAALAALLARLAEDRSWVPAMRKAALQKAQTAFSESVVLAEWSKMLNGSGSGAEHSVDSARKA